EAMALLDVVEAEIKKALAGMAAEYKAKLADWSPAIKEAMAAKGPNAAEIAKLLAQSTALSKPGGDMHLALATLKDCHDLATKSAAQPAGEKGPAANLSDAAKLWKAAHAKVSASLQDFRTKLLADPSVKTDPRFNFVRAA